MDEYEKKTLKKIATILKDVSEIIDNLRDRELSKEG